MGNEEERAELLEHLSSPDRAIQRRACEAALSRLRREPGFRSSLLAILKQGAPLARFAAVWVLFQERPTLRLLAPLLDALELDDGDRRWTAAHMLCVLGRMQGEVLPVLLHESTSASCGRRRRMALFAARELGAERKELERALLAALDDPDAEVRRAALSSFAKLLEPEAATVERVLAILSEHSDPQMRRLAAAVLPDLASHHPASSPAITVQLERAASARDESLARAARWAQRRLETL